MKGTTDLSNLLDHAQRELDLIGMLDRDADYGGQLGRDVLALIGHFSSQGHSGHAAVNAIHLFGKLARFEPLSEITSDIREWMEVSDGVWQSRRSPAVFSKDRGATYYDLDEALDKYEQRVIHVSAKRRIGPDGADTAGATISTISGTARRGIAVPADGAEREHHLAGEGPRLVSPAEALRRIADGAFDPHDNRLALLAGADALDQLERERAGCVNENVTRPA